jgi:hypothetical protein
MCTLSHVYTKSNGEGFKGPKNFKMAPKRAPPYAFFFLIETKLMGQGLKEGSFPLASAYANRGGGASMGNMPHSTLFALPHTVSDVFMLLKLLKSIKTE